MPKASGCAMRRTGSDPMRRRVRGFTLVEMVVAITLIGILAVVTVPLLQLPMSAHLDTARRAALTAELDASVARLRDDLAWALPNSVRVRQVGARWYLEYLEVRASGRYRAASAPGAPVCPATCAAPGANDALEFACSESCFASLGPLDGAAPLPGSDYVVVNPLGPGVPNGDPYFGGAALPPGGIKSRLLGVTAVAGGSRVTMTPHSFALVPADRRFYVVATPVSYECNPATQRLTRYWGYAVAANQPAAFGGATSAPLATRVSACRFAYTPTGGVGGGGVVSVWLRYTQPVSHLGAGTTESAESLSEFSVREAS
jgi:MSHA biogenesis protein MshO